MKKILILPLAFLTFGFFSCTKEVVQPTALDQQEAIIDDNLKVPNPGAIIFAKCDDWGITTFNLNRIDMSAEYKSLTLNFCPDNTVAIFNDILAFNGSWYFLLDKGVPWYLTLDFNYPYEVGYNERPYFIWSEIAGIWQIKKLQMNLIQLQTNGKLMVMERRMK